jgi:hypothetical protein
VLFFIGYWKQNGKCTAYARSTFDTDPSSMDNNNIFRERQAKPGTFMLSGQTGIQLNKWHKQFFEIFFSDADSVVFDF